MNFSRNRFGRLDFGTRSSWPLPESPLRPQRPARRLSHLPTLIVASLLPLSLGACMLAIGTLVSLPWIIGIGAITLFGGFVIASILV